VRGSYVVLKVLSNRGADTGPVEDGQTVNVVVDSVRQEGESSTPPRSMKSPALQGVKGEGYASTI
jgi:hypothetical protein